MQGAGILELISELAIAILGFSGVVVALGSRASGTWSLHDRLRFLGMIRAAACVLVLSLLPFPFHAAGKSGADLWMWCSGIGAVVSIVYYWLNTGTDLRESWTNVDVSKLALVYAMFATISVPVMLALNAFEIVFERTFTPYLSCILLVFGTSVILFLRLIVAPFERDEY